MQAEVKNMTPKEIRLACLKALTKNLGVVGMIRFLQDTDKAMAIIQRIGINGSTIMISMRLKMKLKK